MAKQTTSPKSTAKKKSAGTRSTAPKTRRPRKKPSGPSLWDGLSSGAVWGVVFVLLGILTALALASRENRALTGWWLDQLSLVFGVGMYLTPLAFVGVGLYLYLRSTGKPPALSAGRVFGLLVVWGVIQATAHLLTPITDPLGQTQPGDLGGWVGWVLSEGPVLVLGEPLTFLLIFIMAIVGVMLIMGMGRQQFAAAGVAVLTGLVVFIASIPRLWQRESGVIRARPGWRQRLAAWWMARRLRKAAEKPPASAAYNGASVASPPRDLEPQDLPAADPMSPSLRIIGGDQTAWRLPRVADILEDSGTGDLSEEDLAERARIIEETLHSFGVPVTVIEVNKGPVVTQFGLRPDYVTRKVKGEEKRLKVRVSKIQTLTNDLSLALAAAPIRIEAPVPGRNIVGLEVPNQNITTVSLRSVLESEEFQTLKGPLRFALGQDVSGRSVSASLAQMPHLLVAGATGSGKSVCVNGIICSLLFQHTPDQLRFVMVDPKRVELTGYNGIPHLIAPVVTETDRVTGVLHWATKEMDNRYRELQQAGARNIEAYNLRRSAEGKRMMPFIVIIIDELADIMMMSPEEVEKSLVRLAQMARATGIHLIIATQRPSVDVVTGLIKANFPSRIAFAVTSQIDSRVILDTPGAERLLGRGDMLFMRPDSAKLARLQGAFVSDGEVIRLVRFWRGQGTPPPGDLAPLDEDPAAGEIEIAPTYKPPAPLRPTGSSQRPLWDDMLAEAQREAERDELFGEAVVIVRESGRASTSLLQRRLRVGYTRAARLIDMLEDEGVIGPDLGGSRGREVFAVAQEPEAEADLDDDAFEEVDEDDEAPWQ